MAHSYLLAIFGLSGIIDAAVDEGECREGDDNATHQTKKRKSKKKKEEQKGG
jgi:hypothetical protein